MIEVMTHKGESWSNREIARRCAVSHHTVESIRSSSGQTPRYDDTPRTVTRGDAVYTMDTSHIGRFRAPKISLVETDDAEDDYDAEEFESVDDQNDVAFAREPVMDSVATHESPPQEPDAVDELEEVADELIEEFGMDDATRATIMKITVQDSSYPQHEWLGLAR